MNLEMKTLKCRMYLKLDSANGEDLLMALWNPWDMMDEMEDFLRLRTMMFSYHLTLGKS